MRRKSFYVTATVGAVAWAASSLVFADNGQEKAYRERYSRAKAIFEQRCKEAGLTVKRTVRDVEGIELVKLRKPIPWAGKEYFDPMFPEAAMAGEHRGDNYIKQFLMSELAYLPEPEQRGGLAPKSSTWADNKVLVKNGYKFVEYVDSNSGQRYKCTPDWSSGHPNWMDGQHHCVPAKYSETQYALDYEDLVDPHDRELWIAGTKLKILDKNTGEVVAQLTRFVWDPAFGSGASGRWPWQLVSDYGPSRNCPSFNQPTGSISRYFIDIILIPRQDD